MVPDADRGRRRLVVVVASTGGAELAAAFAGVLVRLRGVDGACARAAGGGARDRFRRPAHRARDACAFKSSGGLVLSERKKIRAAA